MSKGYDKRITDALATISAARGGDANATSTYYAVLEWLQTHPAEERVVSTALSLNTHFSFNSSDRNKLRAYFLVQRTVGGWNNERLATEKTRFLAFSAAAFTAQVASGLNAVLIVRASGRVALDVTVTSQLYYSDVVWGTRIRVAAARAQRAIQKAIDALPTPGCAARYLFWFGAHTDERYRRVLQNLTNISNAVATHGIAFTFTNASGYASTAHGSWRGEGRPRVTLENKFFTHARVDSGGHQVANFTAYSNVISEYSQLHVQLSEGRAVLNLRGGPRLKDSIEPTLLPSQQAAMTRRLATDEATMAALIAPFQTDEYYSYAGTIVHELSHCVASTNDVDHRGIRSYGYNHCRLLAVQAPDDAIRNADSYRLFVEEFFSGL